MARAFTGDELATRAFWLTAAFCVGIIGVIQAVFWWLP